MVSTSSTTGVRSKIEQEQEDYFRRLQQMELKNPRLIGFGISNHKTFKRACLFANGAIIGSAFIKAISDSKDLETSISTFIHAIRNK